MPNARTHCPYCKSQAVKDLAYVLRIPGVDLFQCRTCLEIWHVPKDQNWPPGQDLLGPMKTKTDLMHETRSDGTDTFRMRVVAKRRER